jgi:two-component system nitrogen regulation response regulator GlnG
MASLLVVDDEPTVLHLFRRMFDKVGIEVLTAASGSEARRLVAETHPDVAILDLVLPDQTGLEAFRQLKQLDPRLPVIFMTASGNSDTAIEAMKLGALDYLLKPLDFAEVRKLVDQALEIRRWTRQRVTLQESGDVVPAEGDALVGRCPAMQLVYKAIGRVASQNVTVLIRGESGTGKELVARALYHHSHRASGPFMEVNSAAIPEALLESELFGHERGAFTGADRRRIGKFEQCHRGTLFLDEIGDMSPALQSKILRVLQEQRFERVGGNETIAADVRVIAATNRDLEKMVARNQFRADLYYRLNGYTIQLPPLRERGEDLVLLADYFLLRANRDLGKEVRGVSPAAMDLLRRYSWPGNVRELQSVVRQSVLQTTGPVLLADFLPEIVHGGGPSTLRTAFGEDGGGEYWERFINERLTGGVEDLYDQALTRMETELISRVLRRTGGNQLEAARLLGVTRTTLRTKLRQLGIAIDRVVVGGDEPPQESLSAADGSSSK